MLIYILMTIISCVSFIIVARADGRNLLGEPIANSLNRTATDRYIFLLIGFFSVFIVLGFRYQIGAEYYDSYIRIYNQLKSGITPQGRLSISFRLILYLLKCVNASPQWIFICTSILLLIPLWYVIYKLSPIPWLSCIIYIVGRTIFINMAFIEIGIAGTLTCLSLLFLKENRDWAFLLTIAIAATFHWTAVLFIPMFWMKKTRIEPIYWIVAIGVFSVFSKGIADALREFSSANGVFVDAIYANRFDNTFFSMLFVTGIVCFYVDSNKDLLNDDFFRILYNTHMIGALLSINLNALPYGIYIYWLYYFFEIIFVPYLITRIKDKREMVLVLAGVIVLLSYTTYKDCAVAKVLHCFPYRSYLYKSRLFY